MSEPSNRDRAVWALEAVRVVADRTGLNCMDDSDFEAAIKDMMSNLLHLAESEYGWVGAECLWDEALEMFHDERGEVA